MQMRMWCVAAPPAARAVSRQRAHPVESQRVATRAHRTRTAPPRVVTRALTCAVRGARSTRANAASASAAAAPGASPALTEKHSWRVRTGWRVELPDGTFLAAVETSIRGGLGGGPRRAVSHCPSVGSAGADSLGTAAGGASDGVVPGDSLRAALDALSTLDAAPPPAPSAEPPPPTGGGEAASQATPLPEWRGWRLATGPIDTPPPLAALHAAQAAQQAQAERAHGGTAAAHTAGHAQST